ncbi:MAG: 3'-5' exonuclease [Desulfobacterales bacterium]
MTTSSARRIPCWRRRGRFLEAAALKSDPDVFDTRSQRISLMTIHAAKGLEFPWYLFAGCENGLIPFIGIPVKH